MGSIPAGGARLNMEDEILLAGAAVFRVRAGRTSWLLVKPTSDDTWQLPKGVVRRGESSVRTAIRTISELVGMRGRVLEEAGRTTQTARRSGAALAKKFIYYLVQQKGREDTLTVNTSAKVIWADFSRAREKLASSEKRMLVQARQTLSEWQSSF